MQRVVDGERFRPLSPSGPPELRALITAVNQMVARLEAQQTTLQDYTREVLRGQEAERQRISRDLHDQTMQGLVGLAGRVELCRKALAEGATEEVGTRLAELHTLARDTLAGVQRMSRHLHPRMLEDLGLPAALQALCDELAGHMPLASARVRCEIVGTPVRLPDALELTAFRVVQEALTNVRKHAQRATRVNLRLFFEDGELRARIEDDGPGFTPDTSECLMRQGHLGLAGMRERARLFGGELTVTAAPGEGTHICLRLPYPSELT
jgi:signal transduction histidine kinase